MPYYKVITSDNKIWTLYDVKTQRLSGDDGKFPLGTKFHADAVGESETGDMVVKLRGVMMYTKRKWLETTPEPIPPPPVDEPDLPPTTPPVPEPLPGGLWSVCPDEELADYGYMSRTGAADWQHLRQTPSVFRYDKFPVQQPTDYRVNISAQNAALRKINGYDTDINRINYLYSPGTALFNRTGFPMLQYLTMSFNFLQGIAVEKNCLKFKTLTPASNTTGMSHASHPWFVHRWDIVTMRTLDKGLPTERRVTLHVETPHGDVFWYLTTAAGYGYIPLKWVKPYPYGEE
jgi:hypothetical protein